MKRNTALRPEDHTVVREGRWTLLAGEDDIELDTPPAKLASDPIVILAAL